MNINTSPFNLCFWTSDILQHYDSIICPQFHTNIMSFKFIPDIHFMILRWMCYQLHQAVPKARPQNDFIIVCWLFIFQLSTLRVLTLQWFTMWTFHLLFLSVSMHVCQCICIPTHKLKNHRTETDIIWYDYESWWQNRSD